MPRNIALSTALLSSTNDRDPDDSVINSAFAAARAHGFESLEVTDSWMPLRTTPLRFYLRMARLAAAEHFTIPAVSCGRTLLLGGDDRSRREVETVLRGVDVTEALGAQILVVAIADRRTGTRWTRGQRFELLQRAKLLDLLQSVAESCTRAGVRLCLELHDDGPFEQPDQLVSFVTDMSSSHVGLNPDLGNIVRGSPDWNWTAWLESAAPLAIHWHVKNYHRSGAPAELTQGIVDYRRAVQIMDDAQYRGWVVPETRIADPLRESSRARVTLQGINNERRN